MRRFFFFHIVVELIEILSTFVFLNFIKNNVDKPLNKNLKSIIKNFFGRASTKEKTITTINKTKKVIVQLPLSSNELIHIPSAIYTSDKELSKIIENKNEYDDQIVLNARQRYRMYMNDNYRDSFRSYCKNRSLPVPGYEILMEHKENTLAILSTCSKMEKQDFLAIGDLYRELGEFNKAIVFLEKAKSNQGRKADLEKLTRAATLKIANPLPI